MKGGVPVMVPLVASVMPAGGDPKNIAPVTAHRYVASPPVAASIALYSTFWTASGSDVVVITSDSKVGAVGSGSPQARRRTPPKNRIP